MKKLIIASLLMVSPAVFAGDAAAGADKAQPCAACHGMNGNKPISYYPKLAGQSELYLLHALKAYKNGSRTDAIMAAQVAGLTDEDMADLAAYFAAQAGDL